MVAFKNLNTYDGWKMEGRIVRPGERAKQYHRSEGGLLNAVFHLNQTGEMHVEDLSVGEFISAEEKERAAPAKDTKKAKAPRIKLAIKPRTDNGYPIHVWCGNNTKIIAQLKKAGYRYVGSLHRWLAYRPYPNDVVAGFEKHGYTVDLDDQRGE